MILALREAHLWRQRELAFTSRHAFAAADYARRQQLWWADEASRCAALIPHVCDYELLSHEPGGVFAFHLGTVGGA